MDEEFPVIMVNLGYSSLHDLKYENIQLKWQSIKITIITKDLVKVPTAFASKKWSIWRIVCTIA